jgi:hypothetical protein
MNKRLVLANQVSVTVSYDSTPESTVRDEAEAGTLISEMISKRLKEKGLW